MEKKILVVDDEPFFVEVLTARLSAAGYAVCSARNGDEAFAQAKNEKPQLIIMDVLMPQTSGYEAMQKIRGDAATHHIPAIIFSGKSGMKDFFQDVPGVEFLHKPFDMKVLMARIEALIGHVTREKGQLGHAILMGVEDFLVNKIRDLLLGSNYQVHRILNEKEAIPAAEKIRPNMILCQFWEDTVIMDPRKIAADIPRHPLVSGIPFYVYCQDALSVEAMKSFGPEQLIIYKESGDLLQKLEVLIKKNNA